MRNFILAWLTLFSVYAIRKPIGLFKIFAQKDLGLNRLELGFLDLFFMLPYSLTQVFACKHLDAFKASRLVGFSLFITAVSTLAWCVANSAIQLFLILLICGISQAPQWPVGVRLATWKCNDANGGWITGWLSTSMFIGAFLSTMVTSHLLGIMEWRMVLKLLALPALLVSILDWLLLENPQEKCGQKKGDGSDASNMTIRDIWKMPAVAEVTIALLLLKLIRYGLYFWLPFYGHESLGLTITEAGFLSAAPDLGSVMGGPIIGHWTDKQKGREMMVVVYSSVIATVALMGAIITSNFAMSLICFLIVGVCNSGCDVSLCGQIPSQIGKRNGLESASAVSALVNGVSGLGAAIEGPAIGLLVRHYTEEAIPKFLIVLSALSLIPAFKADLILRLDSRKHFSLPDTHKDGSEP